MSWFHLSWSKFKTYRNCPQHYNWKYNEYKDPPFRDSKHFAVIGSVVQQVFEYYYDYHIYKRNHRAIDILMEKTDEYFNGFLEDNYVNFNHVTCPYDKDEARQQCRDAVEKTEMAIEREGLVGYKNFAEATVQVPFKRRVLGKVALQGRLDFLLQMAGEEHWILDGKSTKNPDRVDDDQLYFYAMLFAMRYGKIPDKLGFFFFRFGDDPDKAIKWLPVSVQKLNDLKEEAVEVVREIQSNDEWKPTPEPSFCNWCPYEKVCDARQGQKQSNREARMTDESKALNNVLEERGGGAFTLAELRDE